MRFDQWEDSNGVPVASAVNGVGKILQVVYVVKTDAQTASQASNTYTTITNFAPSITPISATSKLVHFLDIGGLSDVATKFRISGSVNIPVGDASGSSERLVWSRNPGSGLNAGANSAVVFVDTPGSTSTLTYGLDLGNAWTDTRVFFINRGSVDTASSLSARTTSTWMIMEVAA
jgi:hypothetical protein